MHDWRYARSYRGRLQAVVFDWAGTTVDHGCIAPAIAFVEVFRKYGAEITIDQARAPMGMSKRDHLLAISRMSPVAEAWRRVRGKPIGESDIDAMYADFIPVQVECVGRYADPIPGVLNVVAELRKRGVKIGSNTGYNRQIVDAMAPAAAAAGYVPDCTVSSCDVAAGRPAPWMALECAHRLNVYPVSSVVKVDDTVPGIEEGLNAGMWTVAITETGNEIGLNLSDLRALDPGERRLRRLAAERRLAQAGAHYVIGGVADLLPCWDDIERRLSRGESP